MINSFTKSSMKKHLYFAIYLFSLVFLCSSCANQKKFIYFQKDSRDSSRTIDVSAPYVSKIQPGDILSIYVNSLSNDASVFFNPYTAGSAAAPASGDAISSSVASGFLVDRSGAIELPLIGNLKVQGLTTLEIKDLVKEKLTKFLKEPTVNVRVLNYKVSILGEVNKPAVYVIPNESVTLPEALSMAGDLTVFGRRNNVRILRENNGKKEIGYVDLTRTDLFSSPYYYLHANDVIYVEPLQTKTVQGTFAYRIIPFIAGIVSAALLIFVRLNN